MRRHLVVFVVLAWCGHAAFAEEPGSAETEIRQAIEAYVASFNAGDAAALARLYTERAEMIPPNGQPAQGRQEIERQFTEYFAAAKGAKLELEETHIDVQSPSTAVETGIARVVTPNEEPSETQYRAIHVRTADGWRIDSVHEVALARPPSNYDKLKDLAGLVGDWADNAEMPNFQTSCRWSRNENFLVLSFHALVDGNPDFEGTQIIGWDPREQTVRSWMFDSDGGFGVGRWTKGDGRWTVQTLQVLPDGRAGSATNIYELLDDNSIRFRSIGRQVEGELLPSIGPVTVVRKP